MIDDCKILQLLGLNIIRLGVTWSGVEPFKNQYNITYVNEIKQINVMGDIIFEGIFFVKKFLSIKRSLHLSFQSKIGNPLFSKKIDIVDNNLSSPFESNAAVWICLCLCSSSNALSLILFIAPMASMAVGG